MLRVSYIVLCTKKKREIKGRELKLRTKNDLNENTTSLKKKKKWK